MLKGDIMDYYKMNCPVCSKPFEQGDDVVVCPECGAPHHRECYENLGHCFHEDKHSDSFSYKGEKSTNNASSDKSICPECKKENPKGNRLCIYCGADLPSDKKQEEEPPANPFTQNTEKSNSTGPIPASPFPGFTVDPMGGIGKDTDVGEGVTAAEAAKFTKNNTPFYVRLFNQIKTFNKSRFSFVGFLFSGAWLLYRKMYKLGGIITAIFAAMIFAETFIYYTYHNTLYAVTEEFYSTVQSQGYFLSSAFFSNLGEFFSSLNGEKLAIFITYYSLGIAQIVIQFVCGLCANRWYYKHSIKKINKIKATCQTRDKINAELETKGGVELPLAISIAVSYLLLTNLPQFLI